MELLARIELATSPLPRECSTPELQEQTNNMERVAGIEPASTGRRAGLLRVQCAVDFLGPRAGTHTFPDRPSRVRVPQRPAT